MLYLTNLIRQPMILNNVLMDKYWSFTLKRCSSKWCPGRREQSNFHIHRSEDPFPHLAIAHPYSPRWGPTPILTMMRTHSHTHHSEAVISVTPQNIGSWQLWTPDCPALWGRKRRRGTWCDQNLQLMMLGIVSFHHTLWTSNVNSVHWSRILIQHHFHYVHTN